jgi:hypothetical protein
MSSARSTGWNRIERAMSRGSRTSSAEWHTLTNRQALKKRQ